MSRSVKDALNRVKKLRKKVTASEDKPGLASLTPKQKKAYEAMKKSGSISTGQLDVLGMTMEQFLKMAQIPKPQMKKNIDRFLAHIEQKGWKKLVKASVSAGADKKALKDIQDAWLETDLKLDKTHGGGYIPSAGVLAQRERGRQRAEIDSIGKSLLKNQYASEWEDNKGVWVTYRDNRNRDKWEEKLNELVSAVKKAGYKTRIRDNGNVGSTYIVMFDAKKIKDIESAYPEYLKALAGAGSRAARKKLNLPPVDSMQHKTDEGKKPAHKQEAGEVTYQVVGLSKNVNAKSKDELVKLLKKAGIKMTGVNDKSRSRVELQGQPMFKGLLGPFYNGPGKIRYETQEAYNVFSASRKKTGTLTSAKPAKLPTPKMPAYAKAASVGNLAKLNKHIATAMSQPKALAPSQKVADLFTYGDELPHLVDAWAKMVTTLTSKFQKADPSYGQDNVKQLKAHVSAAKKAKTSPAKLKKSMSEANSMLSYLRRSASKSKAHVSAAKDAGTPKNDKKRQADLESLIKQAATLRSAVSLEAFPEVESALKAIDALADLATTMAEAQIKLRATKSNTEEAGMAQEALNDIRARVDSMIAPLKATASTMEALVLAAAALADKFDAMQSQSETMEKKLKSDKDRLSAIAKAVQTTAEMK